MPAQFIINNRGVVTLPAKIRKAMSFEANDQLFAETTPQGQLLRPTITFPLEMYTPERVLEFDNAEAEAKRNIAATADAQAVRDSDASDASNDFLSKINVSTSQFAQACPALQAATLWLPEKDRPVLQAAIALACDVLVTGDSSNFGRVMASVLHAPSVRQGSWQNLSDLVQGLV